MPIYVYSPVSASTCEFCESGFEVIQKTNEGPLLFCPECGGPVKKTITAANIASAGPALDTKNVEKHGFTKYHKVEKGVYEKVAGKGPRLLSDKKS